MTILISKYKTGIDLPPLTTSLNHLSGENSLTFPYKSGDNQATFNTTSGVHLLLVNGGNLILTDDTDTFSVSFGSSNITITWHSRTSSLADIDDVVFVFNAFAKPTSGITRLKYVATSGQTVFSGNDANGTALTLVDSSLQVFKNDNFLEDTDFTVDTTNNRLELTAPNAASTGDIISIFIFSSVTDQTALTNSVTSASSSATTAGNHSTTAQRWAINAVNTSVVDVNTGVDSNEYSAKAYAIGDNQLGGSAKEWAIGGSGNVSNVVEGSNYSAKFYATQGNVAAVAAKLTEITNVSNNQTNIDVVSGNTTNINAVAGVVSNNALQTVATNIAKVQTAADDLNETTSEIDTVANAITNVNAVGNDIANVNSLANVLAGSTTYVVTVANVGGSNVFVIDGVNTPVLALQRGNTYVFDQSDNTNSNHPLAFKDASGNSYTTGVTVNNSAGSSGATVTFVVASNAPASLRYYCTVHGNAMGNTISTSTSNLNVVVSNIADINLAGSNISSINTTANNISAITSVSNNMTALTSATSVVDAFNNIYLGPQSSAPTQDPDGSALDAGDLYFDSTTNQLKVYGSGGWQNAGSSVNGTSERFHYDITGTPSSVSGSDANGNTLTYDAGFADVYVNGIRMSPQDITITSGNSVVFADALTNGSEVDIVTFGTFSVSSLNASNLLSGTVPIARIGSGTKNNTTFLRGDNTFQVIDLTALSASNLTSGTVPDARFPSTLPAISGANLTNLDASDLASGTIPIARIGSGTKNNTTFLRGDNTFATVTIPPGTTINNNANNKIITGSGTANTLEA